MSLEIADVGLAELTQPEIRDFANRVLYNIALRQAGGEDTWTEASLTKSVTDYEGERELNFRAEWDSEIGSYLYSVEFSSVFQFDDDWTPEGISAALGLEDESEEEELFAGDGGLIEPEGENSSVDTDNEAYYSIDYKYSFVVPYARKHCVAARTMLLCWYFDDDFSADLEVAYGPFCFTEDRKVTAQDISDLVEHSTPVIDAPGLDSDMSRLTIDDLRFMIEGFKKFGLVRKNLQPLSKRFMANLPT